MTEQKQEETMAAKLVEKLRIIVFPILGVVLILCSGHVTRILPYLLGGAMALTAVLRGSTIIKPVNLCRIILMSLPLALFC